MKIFRRDYRGYADESKNVRVIGYDPITGRLILMTDDQVIEKGRLGVYENTCKVCGTKEQIFPVGQICLCDDCMRRTMYDEVDVYEGRTVRLIGMICDRCGGRKLFGRKVLNAKLCLKCMWYVFARRAGRLSIDGTRII